MNKEAIIANAALMEKSAAIVDRIEAKGLPIPTKPKDFNSDKLIQEWDMLKKKHGGLSEIPFESLGEYMDKWSSLISFIKIVEASADIQRQCSEEIKDTIRKQLFVLAEGGRELRDAVAYTDEDYLKYANRHIADMAYHTMVKGLREGYEQRLNAISRELTRRISGLENSKRTN